MTTASLHAASLDYVRAAQRHGRPRLRMTRRGRRVLLVLVAAPLVILAIVIGVLNSGNAIATDSSAPLQYVTVEAGESLWQVASAIAPNADPRDVIAAIQSYNSLESAQLVPGQRIAIPTEYAH